MKDIQAHTNRLKKKWRVWRHRQSKKKLPSKIVRTGFALAILGLLVTIALFIIYSFGLPSADELKNAGFAESTKIVDRNNNLIYEIHGNEKRTFVAFENISPFILDATLALEDDEFYKHPGFDWKAIARSAKCVTQKTVRKVLIFIPNCRLTGGSTITQQFIKNTFLTDSFTLKRKIQEVILARRLERTHSKDEILELYLNRIPYGGTLYGVETASQAYFGIPANEVTLAQAVTLASMPAKPTKNHPFLGSRERLRARAEYGISRMETLEMISKDEAEQAREELKKINERNDDEPDYFEPFREDIRAAHFVIYAKEELQNLLENIYSESRAKELIETGGLTVRTTLDLRLQDIAEEAVVTNMADNIEKEYNVENAALVAQDPQTGEILAMIGSRDFQSEEFDGQVNVATSLRQPGSSIKPLVYTAAFTKGYAPGSVVYDVPTNFGGGYAPNNYNNKFQGPVTFRSALAQSLNIPAVKALYLAGIEHSLELGQKSGITTWDEEDVDRCGLSLVLGGCEAKLVDMVQLYSVFATLGFLPEQHIFLDITDRNGETLYQYQPSELQEVLDPGIAYLTHSILSDNASRTPSFGAYNKLNLPRENGAKTGTTNEYLDAWTLGYVPQLVAGVWAGNNQPSSMKHGGSVIAAPIWHDFMTNALAIEDYEKVESFTVPSNIQRMAVSTLSGKIPSENTPAYRIREDIFVNEFLPSETEEADRITSATICRLTGELADENCPEELRELLVFEKHTAIIDHPRWQAGVDQWVEMEKERRLAEIESTEDDNEVTDSQIRFVSDISEIPTGSINQTIEEIENLLDPDNSTGPQIRWTGTVPRVLEFGNNTISAEIISAVDLHTATLYVNDKVIKSERLFGKSDNVNFIFNISENNYKSERDYVISIVAYDQNNDRSVISENFRIKVDGLPPQIEILKPEPNTTISTQSFLISAKISDTHSIQSVEIFIDGQAVKNFTHDAVDDIYNYIIEGNQFPEAGTHTLTIRAFDEYNNFERIDQEIEIR